MLFGFVRRRMSIALGCSEGGDVGFCGSGVGLAAGGMCGGCRGCEGGDGGNG